MFHYGQGLAHAALGNIDMANAALAELKTLSETKPLKTLNMRREGAVTHLAGIAINLVQVRIHRAQNNPAREIAALEQAVSHQDALPYTEPPLWHYPVRQSLGDARIRQAQYQQALATFEADLHHFPKNPWSLFGLEQALNGLDQPSEQITIER